MLDPATLIVANVVMGATMTSIMLVSRFTLGKAVAGALTWAAGDVVLQGGRLLAFHGSTGGPHWSLPGYFTLAPLDAAVAFVVGGICLHLRALHRAEGRDVATHRIALEALGLAAAWIGIIFCCRDHAFYSQLPGAVIAIGAALTVPVALRLSRRFWGARIIMLIMLMMVVGKLLGSLSQSPSLDPVPSGQIARMFLSEIVIAQALTMGFLMLMQEQVRLQLTRLSESDPLTGLYNRRGLMGELERELMRVRDHHLPLSVALFDLDHFKQVNDRLGHETGDKALLGFAEKLRATCPAHCRIGRWGGEEFVVVMPGVAVLAAATLAERIREAVRAGPLTTELWTLTVSGGIAQIDADVEPRRAIAEMIAAADQRMYSAKRTRDRVCASDTADCEPVGV